MTLADDLKTEARRNGFALAGICPAVTPVGLHQLLDWLQRGYHGQLHYISERADAYRHPEHVLSGARSLLVMGMNYATHPSSANQAGQGRVSNYAWGEGDYHDLIHTRMKQIIRWLQEKEPACVARGVVDTAPLLERDFARLAGLGWIAKNTMVINRQIGSYFFLAVILTDLILDYDVPFTSDHCGTCTACLDACPTQAFPKPYVLDATKCISYLTIEHRNEVDASKYAGMNDWLFGCDICQQVCPWNNKIKPTEESIFQPRSDSNPMDLVPLFDLNDDAFRVRFRKTPLWRAKRKHLLRNAAIVLGNQKHLPATNALLKGLLDEESIVRDACKWALEQIKPPSASS